MDTIYEGFGVNEVIRSRNYYSGRRINYITKKVGKNWVIIDDNNNIVATTHYKRDIYKMSTEYRHSEYKRIDAEIEANTTNITNYMCDVKVGDLVTDTTSYYTGIITDVKYPYVDMYYRHSGFSYRTERINLNSLTWDKDVRLIYGYKNFVGMSGYFTPKSAPTRNDMLADIKKVIPQDLKCGDLINVNNGVSEDSEQYFKEYNNIGLPILIHHNHNKIIIFATKV